MRHRILVLSIALWLITVTAGASSGSDPAADALERLEAHIDEVGDEIERSDLREGLATTWEGLQAELAQTVEAIRTGAAIDIDEIERQLDEFQQQLESVRVQDSLDQAWTELRADLADLVARIG